MLRRQFERYGRWVVVIALLVVVATVTGTWILVNQRLQTPFDDAYVVKAEFATTAGLSPGLGNAVNVSGVRVGTIGDVRLRDGRAVVELRIDPGELPQVHRDARAVLVPNTPLQDLQVELQPGTAQAGPMPEGGLIGIGATAPPRNADELNGVLDADTRALFQALLGSLDVGTKGRTKDLRRLLRAFEPTLTDLRVVTGALADRRVQLRHLVHNLAVLSGEVGRGDRDLVRAVRSGGAVLQAVSAPDAELRTALRRLPRTVDTATGALDDVERLADQLGPTATALLPAARRAPAALRAAGPLARAAEPVLRTRLRPLTRRSQALADDLRPSVRNLSAVTPALSDAFRVLTYTTNAIAYNPPGSDEGFVHWLAWFTHNINSFTSTQDAQGAVWRGLGLFDCTFATSQAGLDQLLGSLSKRIKGCG